MKLKDEVGIDYLRKTIILLHWLLFIIVSFFILYTTKESRISYLTGCFISLSLFFIFNIILTFLPTKVIARQSSHYLIFFVDILIISLNVYFTQGFDSDLYITYFLIIFIAGINQSIRGSIMVAIIASIIYGFMLFKGSGGVKIFDSALLMRIPFLFVVALVSAFFSEETQKYKKQVDEARKVSRELQEQVRSTTSELLEKNEELKNLNEDLKVRITESEILIATLKESEEKYRNIFEYSDDIIFTLNLDGKITTINKKVKDIIGFSEVDCLGRDFVSFLSNDDIGKFTDTIISVRENGHQKIEIKSKHLNGDIIFLNINLSPVYYNREVVGIQGIAKKT